MSAALQPDIPNAARRPRTVEVSVYMLFVAFVAALGRSAVELLAISDRGIVVGLVLFVCALYFFNLYKIWAGRNWARILYTMVFALGCFGSVRLLSDALQESIAQGVSDAFLLAVQIVAVAMLYLPKSNAWFCARASYQSFKVTPPRGAPQPDR